jgi:hypothetical protein
MPHGQGDVIMYRARCQTRLFYGTLNAARRLNFDCLFIVSQINFVKIEDALFRRLLGNRNTWNQKMFSPIDVTRRSYFKHKSLLAENGGGSIIFDRATPGE